MKKIITILSITLLLFACVTKRPPKTLDNICSIFKENRSWHRATDRVYKKWGVPPYTIMAIIHQESRFRPRARPMKTIKGFFGRKKKRVSSAYGYSQALDGTWERYKKATGRRGAKRTNFKDSVYFMGWYIDANFKRNGVAKNNTEKQYLAYHEGMGGYQRGLHLKKPWLLEVAKKVHRRSNLYKRQMKRCPTS